MGQTKISHNIKRFRLCVCRYIFSSWLDLRSNVICHTVAVFFQHTHAWARACNICSLSIASILMTPTNDLFVGRRDMLTNDTRVCVFMYVCWVLTYNHWIVCLLVYLLVCVRLFVYQSDLIRLALSLTLKFCIGS